MSLRGLTIVVADASSERFRSGLILAAAQAAIGGRARVFCQGEAVSLLRRPVRSTRDGLHEAAGLPPLPVLIDEALDLGVELIACQTGLLLTGTDADALDPRIAFGGPLGLLQSLDDDRLVVA